MTRMFSEDVSWFGLAVGVAVLLEAAVFLALRRRRDGVSSWSRTRQLPMLLCMGVMLTTSSAARLRGWEGTGMTVVMLIGAAAAAGTIGFAIRSLMIRSLTILPERNRATPPS